MKHWEQRIAIIIYKVFSSKIHKFRKNQIEFHSTVDNPIKPISYSYILSVRIPTEHRQACKKARPSNLPFSHFLSKLILPNYYDRLTKSTSTSSSERLEFILRADSTHICSMLVSIFLKFISSTFYTEEFNSIIKRSMSWEKRKRKRKKESNGNELYYTQRTQLKHILSHLLALLQYSNSPLHVIIEKASSDWGQPSSMHYKNDEIECHALLKTFSSTTYRNTKAWDTRA